MMGKSRFGVRAITERDGNTEHSVFQDKGERGSPFMTRGLYYSASTSTLSSSKSHGPARENDGRSLFSV